MTQDEYLQTIVSRNRINTSSRKAVYCHRRYYFAYYCTKVLEMNSYQVGDLINRDRSSVGGMIENHYLLKTYPDYHSNIALTKKMLEKAVDYSNDIDVEFQSAKSIAVDLINKINQVNTHADKDLRTDFTALKQEVNNINPKQLK